MLIITLETHELFSQSLIDFVESLPSMAGLVFADRLGKQIINPETRDHIFCKLTVDTPENYSQYKIYMIQLQLHNKSD